MSPNIAVKPVSAGIIQRIKGRATLVDKKTGRELSKEDATRARSDDKDSVLDRHNGPHFNSKWARDLLGTPTQAQVRRARLLRWKHRSASL